METLLDFVSLVSHSLSRNEREMVKLNEYVKIAEAAEMLGVSQNTLRNWSEAGKIKVHRNPANGYRLFRRSELKAFLAKVAKSQKKGG